MAQSYLTNWRAKRAGGRITVYGTDSLGHAARVPHIDTIVPENGKVVATDKDGQRYVLTV